ADCRAGGGGGPSRSGRAGGPESLRESWRPPRAQGASTGHAVAPLHLGTEDLRLPRQERERLTPRSGLAIREARSGDEMVVLGDELLEVIGERPELLPRQVDEPRRLDARTAARQGEVEMRETQAVRGLVGAAQLRALQAPEELVEIARLGGDQLHAH